MINRAILDAVIKNLEYLTNHCGNCTMCEQCEEQDASGDNDFEPRYCKSIIEAAMFDEINFKIPFPKP